MIDPIDRRASSGLRFSFGELPLLKSMAARKLSTCQAQSALEKGVLQLLEEQNITEDMSSLPQPSPHSHQPETSVPTNHSQDTPLFAALSSWSFSAEDCSAQSASKQKTLDVGPSTPLMSTSPSSASRSHIFNRRKSSMTPPKSQYGECSASPSATTSVAPPHSAVHAAAIALADLSEDGFQSALALSRQWRRGQSQPLRDHSHPSPSFDIRASSSSSSAAPARVDHSLSPPRPHPPRSVPVVCRESISWHDEDEDLVSPMSAMSFDLDSDYYSSRSTSSDWDDPGSARRSPVCSALGPAFSLHQGSNSLRLSQEDYESAQSHAPWLIEEGRDGGWTESPVSTRSRRSSSTSKACGLRFTPSLAGRGSTSSGMYFDLGDHTEVDDEGGDAPQPNSADGSDFLLSVADELALMSEQAVSGTQHLERPSIDFGGSAPHTFLSTTQHQDPSATLAPDSLA